jgi:nitrogen fixation-related uncharacterized protein
LVLWLVVLWLLVVVVVVTVVVAAVEMKELLWAVRDGSFTQQLGLLHSCGAGRCGL